MKVCDHWRKPCGYCPTCQCVTSERFIQVPVVGHDGFTHIRAPASSMPLETPNCSGPGSSAFPVDEEELKRALAEWREQRERDKTDSLLRFAEIRHAARQKLIDRGHLVEVLRSDAALEGSVSDAEDIVHATLLQAGVAEPIAELTRTVVSAMGRAFLGMGPSHRDMVETSRKLYGDERTPDQKAAAREKLMGAVERLKVKVAKQQAEVKEQVLGDLESGRMCGGIDKAEGIDL